jgi:S-layer protein
MTMKLSALAADTINLAGINGVNSVSAGGATGAGVINGYTSGGTLTLTTDVGNDGATPPVDGTYTVGVLNAALSTSDVFNINLSKSTLLAAGQITVADVETINITAADAATAGSAAVIHTATLVATGATTINVSGNNGLNLTNAGNTAVTTFNASGVVANGTSTVDTAANLKVTFLSAKISGSTTITGGAGDDVLTGVGATDTISGGGGADAIVGGGGADILTGGEGADTITGDAGNDTINLTETTAEIDTVVFALTASNGIDTITGFAAGTGIDIASIQASLTAVGTAAGVAAVVGTSTNTTLTAGATAFALTGASTATSDVVEITATLSSFGNLAAVGIVNGAELMKGLSSTNVAATSITATASGNDFYLVAYQAGNAYLYEVTNDANTDVLASEIALVGVFNGVAAGAFASGDFLMG